MGLFVEQNSNRTKLQERLAAELNEKAKKKADTENTPPPDGVEDSRYIENTKKTTSLAWAWVVIVLVVVVAAVWFAITLATNP